jgi:PAS domain S-box-containing protein
LTDAEAVGSGARLADQIFRRTLSIGTVAILGFRLNGQVTDANAAFESMSGYRREELLQLSSWAVLTPPEFREVTNRAARDLAEHGETPPYEKQLIRKDGSRWWALCAPTRLFGAGSASECMEFIIDLTDRKKAESALRNAQSRLSAALTAARMGFWDWDSVTERLTTSDTMPEVLGLRPGDMLSGSDQGWDLLHPLDRDRHRRMVALGLRKGRSWRDEFRIVRPRDSVLAWLEERAESVRDPETGAQRVTGLVWDISDRKLAEQALRSSEERLRLIVENARDYAIFVTDAQDRIIDWFAGAVAVFGWTADEAVGQLGDMLFTPEDRAQDMPRRELETARRKGGAPNVRWHQRKDGSRVFIEGRVTTLLDADGAIRGFLKIGQDVTERRAGEEALRESERLFRTLAEGIPHLVFRSNSIGERTWASPQWVAYTGISAAESLGFGWLKGIHPADRPPTLRAWADAEAQGIYSVEHRTRRASDCAYRWFRTSAVPVRGGPEPDHPTGRVIEWVGTSTDIHDQVLARDILARDRKQLEDLVAARTVELMAAEETIRQTQKMEAVGQLTGGIAHDFNNMLQGVSGALDIARRRLVAGRSEEIARYLDMALEATRRAASLTQRLLAFARRQRLDPKSVDPDSLVAGIADLIRRTMGPGVVVELRLRDGAGNVFCDPNELESALLNLCINARDAMPSGGRLIIETSDAQLTASDVAGQDGTCPGSYVVTSVGDTGVGMSNDVLERAFEPFFTTKPQGQGTGLGLSQVYGFVRQSGGLVRIDSTPGHGTNVRLMLPLHTREVDAGNSIVPVPQASASASGTILLVDDEVGVRGPVAERLRELGYRVIEAQDGPEALGLCERMAKIDLLITDVGLPKAMNGRQLAEAARARHPEIPVLFITGYAVTQLPSGADVISKPFDLDLLARRVQHLLPP